MKTSELLKLLAQRNANGYKIRDLKLEVKNIRQLFDQRNRKNSLEISAILIFMHAFEARKVAQANEDSEINNIHAFIKREAESGHFSGIWLTELRAENIRWLKENGYEIGRHEGNGSYIIKWDNFFRRNADYL